MGTPQGVGSSYGRLILGPTGRVRVRTERRFSVLQESSAAVMKWAQIRIEGYQTLEKYYVGLVG
jgi:hypothetical protein